MICSDLIIKFSYFVSVSTLQELDQLVQDYQQSAFSEGTKGNLGSQFKAFQEFCSRYELPGLPASGETLSRFAVWTAVTKRAKTGQTVRNFLSAVRTLHKLCGQTCPTPRSNGQLELTVRGLTKKLACTPRRMFPITKEILTELIKPLTNKQTYNIIGSNIEFHVYKALYLTLFLSFLRLSSLIPVSVKKLDKLRQLIWSRVKVTEKGIILTVVLSKTVQDMSKVQEIPIAAIPASDFCVVQALKNLVNIPGYPCGPDDPIFNLPDGKGGWAVLSRRIASKKLDSQISSMGLNPKKYRWHAFRRGGMQAGSKVVPNLELLRIHGGWQSDAFRVYLDLPATSRFEVTELLLNSLSD